MQKELPAKAEADQDAFMNLAYSIKVNPKKMKKLEKEYTVIKTKEQGDIAVLRVSFIYIYFFIPSTCYNIYIYCVINYFSHYNNRRSFFYFCTIFC